MRKLAPIIVSLAVIVGLLPYPASRTFYIYRSAVGMQYSEAASSSGAIGPTTVNLATSGLTSSHSQGGLPTPQGGPTVAQSGQVFAADFGPAGKAAFDGAIAAIGVNDRTLVLGPGNWGRPSSNIPANVVLLPMPGAFIDPGANDLLIGKLADGIRYKIFNPTGDGKILFGDGATKEVYPEQWGAIPDDSTDCQPAVRAALTSLPNGGVVKLSTGAYKLTTYGTSASLDWPDYNGISLIGAGPGLTFLRGKDHVSTDYNIIKLNASSAAGITGIRIQGITFTGRADQATAPAVGILIGDWIYDLFIDSCEFRWLRGAGVRHSAHTGQDGERHTVQHCYFHDIATAKMTSANGSAAALQACAPKTKWLNNRFAGIGACDAGSSIWHSVYGVNDSLHVKGNEVISGRNLHIRSMSRTGTNVVISDNIINLTDRDDVNTTLYPLENATITGNVFTGCLVTVNGKNIVFSGNTINGSGLTIPTVNYGYLNLNGTNITANVNTILGKGIDKYSTGVQVAGISDSYKNNDIIVSGNLIKDCCVAFKINNAYGASNIYFTGNACDGGANVTTTWLGAYIPSSTKTISNVYVDNNLFRRYYYLAYVDKAIGPATFNNNKVAGVTLGLIVTPDPCDSIECVGTIAMDSIFTSAFNLSYPPSATRVFRVFGTRRVSDNGVVILANAAKPYVWLGDTFLTGGNIGITHLLGGCVGDVKTILAKHAVIIHHNKNSDPGNIQLIGGDFAMTAGNILLLKMFEQDQWQEIGRKQ